MNKLILAIASTLMLSACAYPYLTPPPPFVEEAYDFGTSHPFDNGEEDTESQDENAIQWVE